MADLILRILFKIKLFDIRLVFWDWLVIDFGQITFLLYSSLYCYHNIKILRVIAQVSLSPLDDQSMLMIMALLISIS